jgi:hypothetical protein
MSLIAQLPQTIRAFWETGSGALMFCDGKPTKLAYEIREWLNRDLLQGENYLKDNKE